MANSWRGAIASGYSKDLLGVDSVRYLEKINTLLGVDPFELQASEMSRDINLFPKIEHADIVNYLVLSTNAVSHQEMKAYKSLQSHNYFTSGFVNPEILIRKLPSENLVLVGKVNHSQKLREPPLKVWILAKPSGEVLTAHCTCMAGTGEACSHVGAVLFFIDTSVRLRDSTTCTQQLNAWLPPHLKQVPYLRLKEIDFSSATAKKRKLDNIFNNMNTNKHVSSNKPVKKNIVPKPSDEELNSFFKDLSNCGAKSAILSILPGHLSDPFVSIREAFPKPLTELYSAVYQSLNWCELLKCCEEIFPSIIISKETSFIVEKETVKQAKSENWFYARAGRVTASTMKSVCRTDPSNPSRSLIQRICYPTKYKFSNAATKWGCEHEKHARDLYQQLLSNKHERFSVVDSGFCINPLMPHIGASPDGMVNCHCCGKGVCEVKCPHCHKNSSIEEMATDNRSCLIIVNNETRLDRNHAYYFQAQCQIHECEVDFCDFVIWTGKGIYIERILPNKEFWSECIKNCTHFLKFALLPELVAKWFSTPQVTQMPMSTRDNHFVNINSSLKKPLTETKFLDNGEQESSENVKVCFCQSTSVKNESLIACSNENCEVKLFHWKCLKISKRPKCKTWKCPECKKASLLKKKNMYKKLSKNKLFYLKNFLIMLYMYSINK